MCAHVSIYYHETLSGEKRVRVCLWVQIPGRGPACYGKGREFTSQHKEGGTDGPPSFRSFLSLPPTIRISNSLLNQVLPKSSVTSQVTGCSRRFLAFTTSDLLATDNPDHSSQMCPSSLLHAILSGFLLTQTFQNHQCISVQCLMNRSLSVVSTAE